MDLEINFILSGWKDACCLGRIYGKLPFSIGKFIPIGDVGVDS